MKKLLYSKFTKAFAVVLFLASLVLGALCASQGIIDYSKEDYPVYRLESSFEEASLFHGWMDIVMERLIYACERYSYTMNQATPEDTEPQAVQSLEFFINENLLGLNNYDRFDYFVRWNQEIVSNTSATSEEALKEQGFYHCLYRESGGELRDESHPYEYPGYTYGYFTNKELKEDDSFVICMSLRQDYVQQCREIWYQQKATVSLAVQRTAFCILVLLGSLIYLLCVCGRNANGSQEALWVDRVWIEIHLLFLVGIGIGGFALAAVAVMNASIGDFPIEYLRPGLIGICLLGGAAILSSLLSMIRNVKAGHFVERSGILRLLRWLLHLLVKTLKWLYRVCCNCGRGLLLLMSKETPVLHIAMLLGYTVVLIFCVILALESHDGGLLLLALVPFAVGVYVLARRARDLDQVKKGASRIRQGDLSYKLPEPKSTEFRSLAADINDIGKGLDESMSAKLRAERMKTELITNISHDLKTPLTSIISYTELLSKVDGLPQEAKDYVQIIANKSDRLKQLTQDLFDISKAQSGNEEILPEELDAALLIQQALAEQEKEISQSGLTFCVNTEEGLHFTADGRKMSRVLGNLIQNCLKYAMPGTRVFVSAFHREAQVVIECKNVSAYPMDFTAEEILGRFVRGDSARSTEGNGLGLAIVRSYTELCGGSFQLVLDGDLFKALLSFPAKT